MKKDKITNVKRDISLILKKLQKKNNHRRGSRASLFLVGNLHFFLMLPWFNWTSSKRNSNSTLIVIVIDCQSWICFFQFLSSNWIAQKRCWWSWGLRGDLLNKASNPIPPDLKHRKNPSPMGMLQKQGPPNYCTLKVADFRKKTSRFGGQAIF